MKKIFEFLKTWSDVLFVLPVVALVVAFNSVWTFWFDPTPNVLDAGFLSLLTFNILKWAVVMTGSYYIWQLYFRGDIFNKDWQDRLTPLQSAIISVVLWISILIVSYLVLLRDL